MPQEKARRRASLTRKHHVRARARRIRVATVAAVHSTVRESDEVLHQSLLLSLVLEQTLDTVRHQGVTVCELALHEPPGYWAA